MAEVLQYQAGMSNGFFIREGDAVIAVDGGALYGAQYARGACEDAGVDPSSVRLIVASHTHVDHTCNLAELRSLTGAPIAVHRAGREDMVRASRPVVYPRNRIGDEIMDFARRQGGMPDDYLPPIVPDLAWEGELDLRPYGISGRVMETPGHSLADCCVVLEDGQAIVGDLICQDQFTHGLPTIAYFGYDPDRKKVNRLLFSSLEKLADTGCTRLYAGHGGPFTREQFLAALEAAREEDAAG